MNPDAYNLHDTFERSFELMRQARETQKPKVATREVGTITSLSTGIARVA
jgi:F-type H+-transporting ATPase subunit alpha